MKHKINNLLMATMVMLATTDAFAASAKSNLATILGTGGIQETVTLGFAIFTFFKWIEFFSGFNVGSALKDIILPAILTFLTFKWMDVLGWVGLK